MSNFSAIKSRRLLRVLMSEPLGCVEVTWAFHDNRRLSPTEGRQVLINQAVLAQRPSPEANLNLTMDIRILHHHEPGFGWSFDSPDIPGLIGNTEDCDPGEAERAARFALESEAEEAGRSAPESVRFEHFVPARATAA